MLKLSNVEVKYLGAILVLRGISFSVKPGSVVSILGSNGAGKTTILKAISGLLRTESGEVTSGKIECDGERIDGDDPEQIAKSGIIQAMEGRRVLSHLTVEENLKLGGYVNKKASLKQDFEMVYEYFPKLLQLRTATAGYLSGGEQQMLVIGRAMMAHPKIMLLDEPSVGLAPLVAKEIFKLLSRYNKEKGTTMVIVEQNARIAMKYSDYTYVLENGRIVLEGASDEIAGQSDIKEFYFGLSNIGDRKNYLDVKHSRKKKHWL